MLSHRLRCGFNRTACFRAALWRLTCSHCKISTIPWLSKKLEPQFVRYKKEMLSEYEKLTDFIMRGEDVTYQAKKRWEQLRPIVDVFEELDVLLEADEDIERLVTEVLKGGEAHHEEEDFMALVQHERKQRSNQRKALEKKLLHLVAPFDPVSYSPGASLELVAGAGGREAGIFALDLLEMYRKLSEIRGWRFDIVQQSLMDAEKTTESSSERPISKVCVEVVGEPVDTSDPSCLGAYGQLRCEAGVHRVQRIPVTSKHNKIHTSTVAVSVLPLVDEISIDIPDNELKWEYFRASGAGGQHVNRTDSAVRLTHLPTGSVVTCQRERAQHINKNVALATLKERLRSTHVQSQANMQNAMRRSHIGHMDRSEKIRTYNFPQDRITDHRLSKSWNSIHRFMHQTTGLSELIEALLVHEQQDLLKHELNRPLHDSDK